VNPWDAFAVFALTAFAATAQSVTGFGFGLLIIPPLILLLGPRDAVVLSTVLGTALSVLMLHRLHHQVDWRPVTFAVGGAIAGLPVGLLVLVTLDKNILQVVIALAVLIATAILVRGFEVHASGTRGPLIAGFVGGVTRMAAGLPGPPVVLYFQATRIPPERQRADITAFFVATGVVGVALFAAQGSLDGGLLALALAAIPGIALGWWAGSHIFRRMDERLFSTIVYVMLVGSALLAMATAIL
jgi:hypothetical protein